MSIRIKINRDAHFFINNLNEKIQREEIQTWSQDDDGDYTHTPLQWQSKAWMRAHFSSGYIIFGIVSSRKYPLTKELYAVYHGRFAEMLLAHFDELIESLEITPQLNINFDYFR